MTTPQKRNLLSQKKSNSPQWILTPWFQTTLHNCSIIHSKKKITVGLKHLRYVLSEKLSPFGTWKFQNNAKFYNKIINKCDWTNLTRKNINIYVYTTIDKLPSVDFFPKFASLSLSQTGITSLPSLINWVQCHIFWFYYCYSATTEIDKKKCKIDK